MLRDFRLPLSPEVLAGVAVILDSVLQFWSLPTEAPSQGSVSLFAILKYCSLPLLLCRSIV